MATFELRIDNRLAQMDEKLGQVNEELGQLGGRLAGIETLLKQLLVK